MFGFSPPEWSNGNIDEGQNRMFRWGTAYLGLVQNAISAAAGGTVTDPSGVSFLHESAHADTAWADPVAGTISQKQNGQHAFIVLNWRPYGYGDASAYVKPGATGTLSNIARLHIITPSADRIVTAYLPTTTATGTTTGFTSGGYGGLYVFRFGQYVAALNLSSSAGSITLPPMAGTNAARDWVTGNNYDLAKTRTLAVTANAGMLLTLGNSQADATTASALAY